MSKILVSGLINTETTLRVRGFPMEYYPIDYPFFGVNTAVSGVGYNIAKALKTLENDVTLLTMTGKDFPAAYIREELRAIGVDDAHVAAALEKTPASVVLYDGEGRRQIHCDLKDIQEKAYPLDTAVLSGVDLVAACNINFSRPLLRAAKAMGKTIATDVHVLRDIEDDYSREFMEAADILFLSDEGIGEDFGGFMMALAHRYGSHVIVLGRGAKGTALYTRESGQVELLPAAHMGDVVNTVGAGDALFSAFIDGYASGLAPRQALMRAQVFAAAKIRVNGAAQGFIGRDELNALSAAYME